MLEMSPFSGGRSGSAYKRKEDRSESKLVLSYLQRYNPLPPHHGYYFLSDYNMPALCQKLSMLTNVVHPVTPWDMPCLPCSQ